MKKVILRNSSDIAQQRAEWQRDALKNELHIKQDVELIKKRWDTTTNIYHVVSQTVQNVSFYASGATMVLKLLGSLFRRKKK